EDNSYRGSYRGVFPLKVNQLREVVEEILDAGRPFHHGIEVGSKPEIFAGLAVHSDAESLIICNGYKDRNYIRTALIGRKLGKKVILVAEKVSEVQQITQIAAELGVEPWIGLRVRLLSKGAGKWATSGGEHASDIVYNIMDVCDDEQVPHPNIVSESGRATVAHHSVLVVQAFGAIEKTPLESREIQAADHKLVRELLDIDSSLSERSINEA